MLRKMYLVSPDYLNTVTSKNTPSPPPQPRDTKAGEKHNSSKRLRPVKKIKKKKEKDTPRREHDRWVAKRSAARRGRGRDYDKWLNVRGKLREADIEKKRQIKSVADFLKQVLPASPFSAPRDASHSDTQTEHGPPRNPNHHLLVQSHKTMPFSI